MSILLIVEGLLLGLTTGTLCIMTCGPVYIPILMQKEQGIKRASIIIMQLSIGRFTSYIIFGAFTGAVGSLVTSYVDTEYFVIGSYILISLYLLFIAFIQRKEEKGECPAQRISKLTGNAFAIGMLTGMGLCPSFALALTRAFDSGGFAGGIMLFTGFFCGTTVYFLPLAFLSFFTKKRMFRIAGIFASLLVACYFLYLAGDKAYNKYNKYIVDFTKDEILIINTTNNTSLVKIKEKFNVKEFIAMDKNKFFNLSEKLPIYSRILLLTDETPKTNLIEKFKQNKINVSYALVKAEIKDYDWIYNYFKSYALLGRKNRGFFYKIPYQKDIKVNKKII
jgi:sulfite exporter TauE/SafE